MGWSDMERGVQAGKGIETGMERNSEGSWDMDEAEKKVPSCLALIPLFAGKLKNHRARPL